MPILAPIGTYLMENVSMGGLDMRKVCRSALLKDRHLTETVLDTMGKIK